VGRLALIGVPNPGRPGSEIVRAYVEKSPDHEFSGTDEDLKEDIRRFARERCAPYEVPKHIELIDEMPLTAVGKIDKKLLRK
jgi:long-chain acyl-CoA synthetase